MKLLAVLAATCASLLSCRPAEVERPATGGSAASTGGALGNGGGGGAGTSSASGGSSGSLQFAPTYHPPPGFESCVHAKVEADCEDGWCKLPPSCFVMGSPEDEWLRGANTENQVAVTLTHWIEVQQTEMTRRQWLDLVGVDADSGDSSCLEDDCPITNVTWWDAVHAANLLSQQASLETCYAPLDCEGTPGNGLRCAGVEEPERSIQDCLGYRLPTRAEAEYAARAGTTSAFYSGPITVQKELTCQPDPYLDLIAWYCDNSGLRSQPVAQKGPNGFGLRDLLGNVGEWLNDERSYSSSPGGEDPEGQVGAKEDRVLYGGRADLPAYVASAASRNSGSWSARGPQVGFRLVRTLPD